MTDQASQVEEKYTWDLSTIYHSDEDWESDFEQVSKEVEAAKSFAGHLLDSSQQLLEITEVELNLARRIEKLYVYAHMKNDQDTRVSKYQAYYAKASGLYALFSEVFSFYEPELMTISEEELAEFFKEEEGLELYRHFFERLLKNKSHVLSQLEEELLAGAQEIFNGAEETFSVLDNADILFPVIRDENHQEVEITHGNFIHLMESKNRNVRQSAYEALYSTYQQFQHTYAKTLQTNVKVQNYKARVHHYDSARQAAMSANFIPEKVYDTLIEEVNNHLPLLHRYLKLRQEVLGLDSLKMYDVYIPLSEMTMTLSYDEALEKAEKVLKIFGTEYSDIVHQAFTERWIDVQVKKGKRSGAYSGGSYDTNAFMLLNWQDNLDNLFTLIHETGHSLHSALTRKYQPYVYGDYSIFLAEIASTTNENILTEALLNDVEDEKQRFTILNHYLDGFRGTIFRQTQFAEFEHAVHLADQNGEVLTSDYLNHLYADLNEKYYNLPKEENSFIQYEWARIPHFYYNYYVYQYATGFAAANYLAHQVVHGSDEDKENYLNYLKSGNSDYPLNVIKKAGVDMTDGTYLKAAFKVFEARLNELEELVEKGVHLKA